MREFLEEFYPKLPQERILGENYRKKHACSKKEAGRRGGISAHLNGTSYEYSPQKAKEAGHMGGSTTRDRGKMPKPFSSESARAAAMRRWNPEKYVPVAPGRFESPIGTR